jgi:hypothetical protein
MAQAFPPSNKPGQPAPRVEPTEVFRLNQHAYEAFEKLMPKPGSTANPIEAGYLLGIQFALNKLREGFTVSRQ